MKTINTMLDGVGEVKFLPLKIDFDISGLENRTSNFTNLEKTVHLCSKIHGQLLCTHKLFNTLQLSTTLKTFTNVTAVTRFH